MKKLYCFDFDGTLTTADTMLLFLKFANGKRFWIQFLRHLPLLFMMKIKLADPEHVKKSLIASVIGGRSANELENISMAFFENYYPKIIRKNALDFLTKIDRSKTDMLLVTASLDFWCRPFAEAFGMKLLATQAEFRDKKFTGHFLSPNCKGPEKVRRIKQEIGAKTYDKRVAFGDTAADRPMLDWADEGHYRFFS